MIIMLSGYKESGKDTIANYIAEKYDYKKIAFADPSKRVISSLTGFTLDEIETMKRNSNTFRVGNVIYTMREFLRDFNEFIKREVYEGVWAEAIVHKIMNEKKVVISDLRFKIEADIIVSAFIDYDNPSNIVQIHVLGGEPDSHVSEQPKIFVSNYYVVDNSEKDERVFKEIDIIIEKIEKEYYETN